jgi:DnaJ-class molecular chaperone
MVNYYQVLDVPFNASQDMIREQYHLLIQAWHPDKFQNPSQKAQAEIKAKEINEAFSILSDLKKRAEYDRKLRVQLSPVNYEQPKDQEKSSTQSNYNASQRPKQNMQQSVRSHGMQDKQHPQPRVNTSQSDFIKPTFKKPTPVGKLGRAYLISFAVVFIFMFAIINNVLSAVEVAGIIAVPVTFIVLILHIL